MKRYPGIQSFTDERRTLFFGRKQETTDVYQLIMLYKMVVLFGKSGYGKTSLLQAGVVPLLAERDIKPVFLRISGSKNTNQGLLSPEMQVRERLIEQGLLSNDTPQLALWDYLKRLNTNQGSTPLLIFDQFEELFSLYAPEQRHRFITELAEVLTGYSANRTPDDTAPVIKIIFSLRSDYLFLLDKLSNQIPDILSCRYELPPLSLEAAKEAILRPAGSRDRRLSTPRFDYDETALKTILDTLAAKDNSGEIESAQLQLVCERIESMVKERDYLVQSAFFGGEEGIKAIQQNFYQDIIKQLPNADLQLKVQHLIGKGLIQNKRRIMQESEYIQLTFGVPEAILLKLTESRLLRKEPRQGRDYYEISHDTLVAPISDVYAELLIAEEKIEKERLAAEQAAKIQAQEAQLNKERGLRRRASLFAVLGVGLAVVAAVAAIYGYQQAKIANAEANNAKATLDRLNRTQRVAAAQRIIGYANDYVSLGNMEYACENYKLALDTLRAYPADSLYIYTQEQINQVCKK